MKITINGSEKEIIFSEKYTHKLDREYNKILFEWTKLNSMTATNGVDINMDNVTKANEYLIVSLTNLTYEELDELTLEEYEAIFKECERIKNPSK